MKTPPQLTIKTLTAQYNAATLTPRQVVEGIIERSLTYVDYNIWIIEPSAEFCEPYLQALESKTPEERKHLPLFGIPFAVKDNIDLAGHDTTAACPAYSYRAKKSAAVVEKLISAGAIPVGKTNLDQFATGLVGMRSPYGECHNALNPELISGGSSSGSAVSVALGLSAFALGTDTAGSGRVPAALNGLVGYKPPLGSWSTQGVVPACASLDCATVFAHTLEDAMAVDSVAKGFDASCTWSRNIADREARLPSMIYLPQEEPLFYGPFEKEYRAHWHDAIASVKEAATKHKMKVDVLDTSSFSEIAALLYDGPWVAERWSDLGDFVSTHPDDVFPVTKTILESGNRSDLSAADQFSAYHRVMKARHDTALLLEDAVLIMPTSGGTFTREQVREDPFSTNSLMGLYTNHCNLCDLAALAIPCGMDGSLPFGITIFGPPSAKERLFCMARALLAEGRTH